MKARRQAKYDEIIKLIEEFLQVLKEYFKLVDKEREREWHKRNAKAFVELIRVKNWFDENDNLVILFTDAKIVTFLKEIYALREQGIKSFFVESDKKFKDIFWQVFPYLDEDEREEEGELERRLLVYKGGKNKTVVYVINFCKKGKLVITNSFIEAFRLIDDGTGEALKVFEKYKKMGYFEDEKEEKAKI